MDNERQLHLEDLRRRHQRRLQALERQVATFGVSTAPEILIEIEEIQAQVARIDSELEPSITQPEQRERAQSPHPKHRLPAQTTKFIGRESEVANVCALLRHPDIRLVTLTGPGGTGKTRMGLQVATALFDDFPDGVFFIALATVNNPVLVAPTFAQSLGIREEAGQTLRESITAFLSDQRILLLIDNFEQIVDAAPLIGELLMAAPNLKMLVTSRVVLNLYGEHEFAVPALAAPDLKHLPLLEQLTQYEAVQLFIERAMAIKPTFAVTNKNAPAVAEICVRLDGLPLALELAAARIKMFSPQQLLEKLSSRLTILTGGARDLPARQQTLRGAIDWSYDLLENGERVLFARLAVFAGGCTLEAAATVCNASGDLPIDILDGVASLVDKSLLRKADGVDDEARFVMLETMREYGLEQLQRTGEETALRIAHAAYYCDLAEQARAQSTGPQQDIWLKRLDAEHDNLRAALGWYQAEGNVEALMQLARALRWFWLMRGYYSEGQAWLEWALAQPATVSTGWRARVLRGSGEIASAQGLYAQAAARLEESLTLFRQANDLHSLAYTLNELGIVADWQGDYPRARTLIEEGLAINRQLGDRHGIAMALFTLADTPDERQDDGQMRDRKEYIEESLALSRQLGSPFLIAYALYNLGCIVHDYARLHESLALFRQLGHKHGIASVLTNLGTIMRDQGNYVGSIALYGESLALWREMGQRAKIATCLDQVAILAVAQHQFERAAHFWGAAETLRVALGIPVDLRDRATRERNITAARTALGEAAFAAAWNVGLTMPVERATDEVMELLFDADDQS